MRTAGRPLSHCDADAREGARGRRRQPRPRARRARPAHRRGPDRGLREGCREDHARGGARGLPVAGGQAARLLQGEVSDAPPNPMRRDFRPGLPSFPWLTDITELPLPAGRACPPPVTGCFDGAVVSWNASASPDADLASGMPEAERPTTRHARASSAGTGTSSSTAGTGRGSPSAPSWGCLPPTRGTTMRGASRSRWGG